MKALFSTALFLTALCSQPVMALSKVCKVQSVDLKDLSWGTPSARVYLDCSSRYVKNYLDFHFTNRPTREQILPNLKKNDVLQLEVSENQSQMYNYPTLVLSIKEMNAGATFVVENPRNNWLMFVSK